MFLIVIGVIALIFGFVNANIYSPTQRYSNIIKLIGVTLIFIGVAISSVVQIGPGEVGVQKLFGKVNSNTLESGLNVINPLVEVTMFDMITCHDRSLATSDVHCSLVLYVLVAAELGVQAGPIRSWLLSAYLSDLWEDLLICHAYLRDALIVWEPGSSGLVLGIAYSHSVLRRSRGC